MPQTPSKRIRPLDGLRGLAALVVLVHHSILASVPKLDLLYNSPTHSQIPARGSFSWLIFYTPLHIFWAGPEFVAVFFVLSGFVISLPLLKSRRLNLASYYPSRLLRLYLPVWAALGFAALLHVAVSHNAIPGASAWLNGHNEALSWTTFLHSVSLGPEAGNWGFNTVLWTMYWIVLFALLLPLVAIIPFNWRVVRAGVAVACFGFLLYGTGSYSLELPPFVLGVVLAFEKENIERVAQRLRKLSLSNLLAKSFLGIGCICLLTADRWIEYSRETLTLVVLGAFLSVICAIVLVSWRKALETSPMQWVGKRAFSLYLVHEPIVVALAFALGATVSPWLFVPLAAVLALSAAMVFFRFVESPSHRFARDVGTKTAALFSRTVPTPRTTRASTMASR